MLFPSLLLQQLEATLLCLLFLPFILCCIPPSLNSWEKSLLMQGTRAFPGLPFSCPTGTLILCGIPEEAVPDGLMEVCSLPMFFAALHVFRQQKGLGCIFLQKLLVFQHNWALLLLRHSVPVLRCFHYISVPPITIPVPLWPLWCSSLVPFDGGC